MSEADDSSQTGSWLVLGNHRYFSSLATMIHQTHPFLLRLVTASKQLPPLQVKQLDGDCPVLLYGQCLKPEDTEMFVFQYLSSLSGPWKGILIPESSPHVFLGAYLARFLKLPLIVACNQKQISYSDDLIWALSTFKGCLVSENRQILTEFVRFNPGLTCHCIPFQDPSEQASISFWLDLLQNKCTNFE